MRISKSVLKDPFMADKIFQKSISKTNDFLKEIFEIDFEKENEAILEKATDEKDFTYNVSFKVEDRNIQALFSYHEIDEGFLREKVKLIDEETSTIDIGLSDDFDEALITVKNYLEEFYGLNFLVLDPEEEDARIIVNNITEQGWECLFDATGYSDFYMVKLFKNEQCFVKSTSRSHDIFI